MTVSFNKYNKIKDKYCIVYYGNCNEYIMQLLYLVPAIEKELPGIQVYVACRNPLIYLRKFFGKKLVTGKEMGKARQTFAYVRELKCNMVSHPVEDLLIESNLEVPSLTPPQPTSQTKKCVIWPHGILPTNSIDEKQIELLKAKAITQGYEPQISKQIEGAGWVIVVESEPLFMAAIMGIRTTLIPTGLGTNFYQKLFPLNEIL